MGSSDHNCILIKSHVNHSEKPSNKRIYKRDLRESRIRHFGLTITTFDWLEIYDLTDVNEKYNRFNEIVSAMIECYFPNKSTHVRASDKPWITQSLKSSVGKRQMLFHKYGKGSETYKYWRNKVQRDVKLACGKYYRNAVEKLKSTNSSRWWKEVKSFGGLKCNVSWPHQLLSDVNPTFHDLAESYNNFLIALTSYFKPLPKYT